MTRSPSSSQRQRRRCAADRAPITAPTPLPVDHGAQREPLDLALGVVGAAHCHFRAGRQEANLRELRRGLDERDQGGCILGHASYRQLRAVQRDLGQPDRIREQAAERLENDQRRRPAAPVGSEETGLRPQRVDAIPQRRHVGEPLLEARRQAVLLANQSLR